MSRRSSLYADLIKEANQKSSGGGSTSNRTRRDPFQFRSRSSSSSSSSNNRPQNRGNVWGNPQRRTQNNSQSSVSDRPQPIPIKKDGRVQRADDQDRDIAYQPPVPRPNQAVAWSPPTLLDILADLGLRLIEVGIASMAQEVAYFFTKRRFLPRYMRQQR